MAHFAELDETNIVKQIIVVHNNELLDENGNESEEKGIDFCISLFGGTWIKTSYNAATNGFRKNFAGIGSTYDEVRDAFIPPKPNCHLDLITFDEETCLWNCSDASHITIQGE
jgi:hypothetical protein